MADSIEQYQLLAAFGARIRRPKPVADGMVAELFATNGSDADAVLPLGRTEYQGATVDVDIRKGGETLGGFQAEVQRPAPLQSGMVAKFLGEDGDNADAIAALSLSKYQDAEVSVEVRLVKLPNGATAKLAPVRGPFAEQSAVLFKSFFPVTKRVWEVIGGDDDFLAWLRLQPCCISTKYGEHGGDVVPMHVWRLEHGAGKSIKPQYSAIPGCNNHHMLQHQHGEQAVGGTDYYDKARVKYLRLWVWDRLKGILAVQSMADADPVHIRAWATDNSIQHLLPPGF